MAAHNKPGGAGAGSGTIRKSDRGAERHAVDRKLYRAGRNRTGVGLRVDDDVVVVVRGGVRLAAAQLKGAIILIAEIRRAAHDYAAVDADFPGSLGACADGDAERI